MHVLVDGLIGFAATALVLAFFGIPLWVMIIVGWVIGLVAAPFTHRLDERQLAERAAPDHDEL
jgi:hypothetical protein